MGAYYNSFLEDGWDELETVALMSEQDLDEVGIKKTGHKRKIFNALRSLSVANGSGGGGAGSSTPASGSPSGGDNNGNSSGSSRGNHGNRR